MANYNKSKITLDGINLENRIRSGEGSLEFVCMKTGSGIYTDEEKANIDRATDLKEGKQTFFFSGIKTDSHENTVYLKTVINNKELTEGYYLSEIGIYARLKGEDHEILYCIATVDNPDYMPPRVDEKVYEIVLQSLVKCYNADNVTILYNDDTYALAADLDGHLKDYKNPHRTTAEQVGLGNCDNTSDKNKPLSDAAKLAFTEVENEINALGQNLSGHVNNQDKHIQDGERDGWNEAKEHAESAHARTDATKTEKSSTNGNILINGNETNVYTHPEGTNPHGTTKSDVGLGNVPNVSTNDQTPTYSAASTNEELTSGEKLSISMGKIAKAISSLISHLANKSNPHGVTKSQVGLGNVPNVATNDQTPTYSVADSNTELTSGEKLSTAMGKIAKAVSSLILHLANKSNPHGVTKSQVGLGNVDNTSDVSKPVSTAQQKAIDDAYANSNYYTDEKIADLIGGAPSTLDTLKEIADAMKEHEDVVQALNEAIGTKANESEFTSHVNDSSNPHGVTKSQVGLGNVPNVATNDQTPTYTAASANANLTSGEKLSVAFGKIAKAISSLISHLANKSNPHGVTASQIGAMSSTNPTGTGSFSMGRKADTTIGTNSHSEGDNTTASGNFSHAEGSGTTASGGFSHAEGSGTTASGGSSHAEGSGTTASGGYSHAGGSRTIAAGDYQTAIGKYNIEDKTSAFIVGNGTSTKRSNAMTVDWDGNLKTAGDITNGNGVSLDTLNSNLIKCENVFYNVTIPANNTTVFNVYGFSGKGSTAACIINTEYDLIQANGHMNADNTVMRVTVTNLHTAEQTINVSAIRLYI